MASDVTTIMNDSQVYATNAVASADTFLSGLASVVNTSPQLITVGIDVYENWHNAQLAIDTIMSRLPSSSDIVVDRNLWPVVPSTPTLAPISPISDVSIPAWSGTSPTLDFGGFPTTPIPTFGVVAPTIDPIAVPTKPNINDKIPAVPDVDFSKINVPDPISLDFTYKDFGNISNFTLEPPSNTFEFAEEAYQSTLLDEAKSVLLTALQDGKYINSDLWDDTWSRAKDREAKILNNKLSEIRRTASRSGFPVPPGYISTQEIKAKEEYDTAVLDTNREVAMAEIQVHIDNWKFTITEARSMEDILINFHGAIMERALNTSKAVVDASIAIYEANITKARIQNEIYLARADVYRAEISATQIKAEAWRTQLEGVKIQGEIQQLKVEVYKALIEGLMVYIDLYRAEMEGAKIAGELEKQKSDIYLSQVSAYSKEVEAYSEEFKAYESKIRGQIAKVTAFNGEVNAFVAQVDAEKAKLGAEELKLRADISVNEALLEEYNAKITKYKAELDAITKEIDAKIGIYGADISGYNAQMDSVSRAYGLEREAWDNYADRRLRSSSLEIEKAKSELQHFAHVLDTKARAGSAGADVYKGLTIAALGAVNTLSSIIEYDDNTAA